MSKAGPVRWLNRLLEVPVTDPDDARRRGLLNVLQLATLGTALAGFAITGVYALIGTLTGEDIPPILSGAGVTVCAAAAAFVLNRLGHSRLAGWLLLLLWTVAILLSDKPQGVASGRTTGFFAVPIVLASVLLRPRASYAMAAVAGAAVTALAPLAGIMPDLFAVVGFFLIAFASWLSARSLERAVREARSEASTNRAILDGIADGVVVFDTEWRVTAANPAFAALAARPTEQLTGQPIDSLMAQGGARGWDGIRHAPPSRQPARFDWGGRTLSATLSPVRDPEGQVAGQVAVLRDVTEEAELQRARESLFAVAAHELRTPLNAIINYAHMLRDGVLPPDQHQRTATRISANGERLLILANNLLERAKMEAGEAQVKVIPFAPQELLHEMHAAMDVLADEKGLALTSKVADDVPQTISGDRHRLYQVLVNLVGNAVKFTDEGAVRVRVYTPDEDHWAIEVTDTGVGIPQEAQGRVFEPFELAEDPATRKHAGAGLGLAIVKQMVGLMGGEVWLESAVGKGSTFTVVLPVAPGGVEE